MISANFRLYYSSDWLDASACNAIIEKFGRIDGVKVIDATNTYLDGLDSTKASALASYLNEDPMMVCSLPLTISITMPERVLESVDGSANPAIDTGIPYYSSGVDYKIESIAEWQNVGVSGWWSHYSAYKDESSNTFRYIRYDGTSDRLLLYWNSLAGGGGQQQTVNVYQKLHVIHDMNGMTINGTYYARSTSAGSAVNGEVNFILGFNSKDRQSLYKHWVDGVLVRHMIPCKHNGAYGMLDIVNMVWRGNIGTGSLTIPDVEYEYQRATYLTAAGFGRYRITAASLGNLDLLGTFCWLKLATKQAILAAFGQRDGKAVIKATNAYLNQLAASDRDKATALAGFINEDPMMVCSLGLQPQGVTMPERSIIFGTSDGVNTGLKSNDKTILKTDITFTASSGNYQLGSAEGGDSKDWRAFDLSGTLYWDCGSARITRSLALNTRHTLEIGNNYTIVDGSKNTGTTQSASAIYANTIYIGYGVTLHDVAEIYDGTDWHRIVPSEQNGVVGMIDFADMSFHAATGTPTIPDISYTPSTP